MKLWAVLVCLLILSFTCACDLSRPDVKGMTESCRACFECLYLNQKNPDKSVCSFLCTGCKASNDFKECIAIKEHLDLRDCLLQMKK